MNVNYTYVNFVYMNLYTCELHVYTPFTIFEILSIVVDHSISFVTNIVKTQRLWIAYMMKSIYCFDFRDVMK